MFFELAIFGTKVDYLLLRLIALGKFYRVYTFVIFVAVVCSDEVYYMYVVPLITLFLSYFENCYILRWLDFES